jgi:hypothetical protein
MTEVNCDTALWFRVGSWLPPEQTPDFSIRLSPLNNGDHTRDTNHEALPPPRPK